MYLGENLKLKMLVKRIYLVPKRFFGIPTFFNYAIADGLYNLLFADKTGVKIAPKNKNPASSSVSTSAMKWTDFKTQETL